MNNTQIGIVTYIHGSNYGCVLQRYALQTTFRHNFTNVESLAFPLSYSGKKSSDGKFNRFFSSGFSTTLKKVVMFIPRRLFYVCFEKPQRIFKKKFFVWRTC